MMIVYRLFYIILFLYTCTVKYDCEASMYEPSFVSDWYQAEADTGQTLIIYHNLAEYPVKVDIQVKINESGEDYIFSGLGSSQRDDDLSNSYGGVVYKYNDHVVQLSFPYRNNGPYVSRGLTYTASDGLYHGPTYVLGPYVTGYVRARMWIATDMPQAVFTHQVSMSNKDNYKEIHHNLGYYPDMVTVQTLHDNSGFMSDGIGAVFFSSTTYWYHSIGGVLYGYDDTNIRLWVPSKFSNYSPDDDGGVFAATDGYTLGYETSGVVKILAWKFNCSQQVYYNRLTVGSGISHDSIIDLPCQYNFNDYFVSFQVKIPNGIGVNGGMIFYGAGSTQANGVSDYGGVVYAYSEEEILFWRPSGVNVVYIGGRWGSGMSHQASTTADIIVRIFYLPVSECPYPETVGNSTFIMTGVRYSDTVKYTCITGYVHTGGDLERTCGRDRRWDGLSPFCTIISCPVPDLVGNGSVTPVSPVYLPSTVITYQCDPGFVLTGGSTSRTCNSNGVWDGVPPACTAISWRPVLVVEEAGVPGENHPIMACMPTFSGSNGLNEEEMQDIITKLRVSKKSTSSHKRSLKCASDERVSSQMLGIGGVIIISSIFCFFIMADASKVFTYFLTRKSTKQINKP